MDASAIRHSGCCLCWARPHACVTATHITNPTNPGLLLTEMGKSHTQSGAAQAPCCTSCEQRTCRRFSLQTAGYLLEDWETLWLCLGSFVPKRG